MLMPRNILIAPGLSYFYDQKMDIILVENSQTIHHEKISYTYTNIQHTSAIVMFSILGIDYWSCQIFLKSLNYILLYPFGRLIQIYVYVLAAQSSASQTGPKFKTVC